MTTLSLEGVQLALERMLGGKAKVSTDREALYFEVDAGPRTQAVGGFCGGTTSGVITRGEFVPWMNSGTNPLSLQQWYDLLSPMGWFPVPP